MSTKLRIPAHPKEPALLVAGSDTSNSELSSELVLVTDSHEEMGQVFCPFHGVFGTDDAKNTKLAYTDSDETAN